jgi:hypothetical protein
MALSNLKLTVVVRLHDKKCLSFLDELLFQLSSNKVSNQIILLYCLQNLDEEPFISELSEFYQLPFYFLKISKYSDARALFMKESILKCNTEYLTFLDYDDFPSMNGYFESIQVLDLDPKIRATFGAVERFNCEWNSGNRYINNRIQVHYTEDISDYLFYNPFPIHSAVIRIKGEKKEIANCVNVDLERLEDYWFLLNISLKYKTKILPKSILMGTYFIYSESNMNTDFDYEWDKARAVLDSKVNPLRLNYLNSGQIFKSVSYKSFRRRYRHIKKCLTKKEWLAMGVRLRAKLYVYYFSSLTFWSIYSKLIKK